MQDGAGYPVVFSYGFYWLRVIVFKWAAVASGLHSGSFQVRSLGSPAFSRPLGLLLWALATEVGEAFGRHLYHIRLGSFEVRLNQALGGKGSTVGTEEIR